MGVRSSKGVTWHFAVYFFSFQGGRDGAADGGADGRLEDGDPVPVPLPADPVLGILE